MVKLAPRQEEEAVSQVGTLQTRSNPAARQATGLGTDQARKIAGRIRL